MQQWESCKSIQEFGKSSISLPYVTLEGPRIPTSLGYNLLIVLYRYNIIYIIILRNSFIIIIINTSIDIKINRVLKYYKKN